MTARILGLLLMLFSSTMLIPLALAAIIQEDSVPGFVSAFGITLFSGMLLWFPVRNERRELRIRDGFLITSLFWIVLGIFGALPLTLTQSTQINAVEAVFESISGLTTTGATVITGLDQLPLSILFYRQMLQWLGGIGIIVVAVAILPMLGVGGMQLYRAEIPGPSKDQKLTPRIAETAKALFMVYVALTIACTLAYFAAGMSVFDAVCHALSTVAIGGFSTHDASIGYFDSSAVMLICTVFMVISAMSFFLHFTVWRARQLRPYHDDSETCFFASALLICIAVTCSYLILKGTFDPGPAILHGLFQAVSIATTTGFATSDFAAWPTFLPLMLMMFSFMGGCVGSTGGGMKAMRVMLIYKQGVRELKQLVHPQAVIPLKVGNRRVEAKVISAVWSFFAVYVSSYSLILLILMATGLEFLTAFSAVAATLNNLGPGLGAVASNYSSISDTAKAVLCVAMLLGRLEIFTLAVLFTPMFWRQ